MILSSKKHYNEIDIKNIKIKEKKKGIILIFKSVTNQKTNKISNFIKKYIIWYDCIPLLESNFTKDEIENIKYLIKQKEYAFMNRNITSVKAMHQNGEVLEFNINYYRFKELYTSAFELIKKSLIFIILVLINLPFMYFTLLLLLYFLLFFSMPIQPFHIFSVIILLFSWTCIIFIGEFHLRKYTKGLSIKIKDGYMILTSKQRYDVIDINKIKIKEKKNGIVLIFKRAMNQKISMLSNFIKKINIWYDCIPLLESNFTKEEMEIIKYVINRKGDQL